MEVSSSSLNMQILKDENTELCRLTRMLKCMLENDFFINVKNNKINVKENKEKYTKKNIKKIST